MKRLFLVLFCFLLSAPANAVEKNVELQIENTDWKTIAQEMNETSLDSLQKEGFDFRALDSKKNPLFYYVLTSNPNYILIKKLIEYGVDVNQPSANNILPLNVITSKANEIQLQILTMQTMGLDIHNPKIKDAFEEKIFEEMSAMLAISQLLINAGADVNKKSSLGTPLMNAATNAWNIDILKLFIDSGADLNAVDATGRTALFYAALAGNTDIIDVLLKAGANPDIKDQSGKTYKDVLKTEK